MANITEEIGDIFSAPANSVLIHACNAKGVWGTGVALTFKEKLPLVENNLKQSPKAFKAYADHCKPQSLKAATLAQHQSSLAGTALLIPPSLPQENHWIACLFTSVGYGGSVDSPEKIVANTERAIDDLARQIRDVRLRERDVTESMDSSTVFAPNKEEIDKAKLAMGSCWSVRLNSGKFGVDWSRTKAVLERGTLDINVVRPPS